MVHSQRNVSSVYPLRNSLFRVAFSTHPPREAFTPCIAVCVALTMTTATAAQYPTKPIRLIVPFVAGSAPDIQARLIAGELTKQMGQQVEWAGVIKAAGI